MKMSGINRLPWEKHIICQLYKSLRSQRFYYEVMVKLTILLPLKGKIDPAFTL